MIWHIYDSSIAATYMLTYISLPVTCLSDQKLNATIGPWQISYVRFKEYYYEIAINRNILIYVVYVWNQQEHSTLIIFHRAPFCVSSICLLYVHVPLLRQ